MTATAVVHRRGAPGGLLVALLFAVVAGVLGMHGFGSHGVAAADHMPTAHTGGVASYDQMAVAPGVHEMTSTTAQQVDRGADGDGMSLGELCVAVLSTLGFLLLVLQALHRRPAMTLPPPQAGPRPIVCGRDRDPPSLARLSVLRR